MTRAKLEEWAEQEGDTGWYVIDAEGDAAGQTVYRVRSLGPEPEARRGFGTRAEATQWIARQRRRSAWGAAADADEQEVRQR